MNFPQTNINTHVIKQIACDVGILVYTFIHAQLIKHTNTNIKRLYWKTPTKQNAL